MDKDDTELTERVIAALDTAQVLAEANGETFFLDYRRRRYHFYPDNFDDEVMTFHHEGKTRTLDMQALIELIWGNGDG